jgi:excisionase family DNA binding protein
VSKSPKKNQPAERRERVEVPPTQRRAYTVNEFCAAYRCSRPTAYVLMNSGKLKSFKIGKARRIPVEAAEALMSNAT